MEKVTIRDVAKLANVSVSSVSHVFNNYDDISKETQDKVQKAAKELGYIPNSAARLLSSKQVKTVALILNDIYVTRGVAMQLEIISGVIDYLDNTEYEFVFYAINLKKQKEKTLRQFCNEHNISGLIIQGLRTSDPYYEELATFDLPAVAIDLDVANKAVGKVSIDNERASYEMTKALLAQGHKKILFMNGDPKATVSHEREVGYRKAVETPHVVFADYREEKAYEVTMNLFKDQSVETFDAIFAASDMMAIGCLKALKKLAMIDQIALVGFDDITLCSYTTPTLSTVRQDISKIAQVATEDLVGQMENGIVKHSIVDFELIERESAKIF